MKKNMRASELLHGDAVSGGTANDFNTGDWRSEKPVWHKDKCINCYFCWINCPDTAVLLDQDKKVAGFDYDKCKGCGICAHECPVKPPKAITMEPEKK